MKNVTFIRYYVLDQKGMHFFFTKIMGQRPMVNDNTVSKHITRSLIKHAYSL